MNKRKHGERLILCGGVLLLAAIILLLYNLNRDWDAKNAGFEILSELDEAVAASEFHAVPTEETPSFPDDMDSVYIGEYEYVGYLTIPFLGVELPVCKTWSYQKLKTAPCRYAGAPDGNDLVICAHNYRSHFGRLARLAVGAEVRFKDVHGAVTRYKVVSSAVLAPTAIDEVKQSDADLTLFTCTYGGRTRFAVRCEKQPDKK